MTEHGSTVSSGSGDQQIFQATIVSVDGEAAIEIPPAILTQLGLKEGDTLSIEVASGQTRALMGRKVPAPRD